MLTLTLDANSGTGATGQIQEGSDKFKGRILITTGTGVCAGSLVRLNVGEGNNYDSDLLITLFTQRSGTEIVKTMVAGDDSTGFEIFTTDTLSENTSYEWNYSVQTIIN